MLLTHYVFVRTYSNHFISTLLLLERREKNKEQTREQIAHSQCDFAFKVLYHLLIFDVNILLPPAVSLANVSAIYLFFCNVLTD